ncbi:MAG: hypothetical protein HFJ10_02195 [Lachnospiraceae bacterium]|nr:hypothetical protein [Lachnospiraceae bacterium]
MEKRRKFTACNYKWSILSIIFILLFSSCGRKSQIQADRTPEETARAALEALQELDLDTFNDCTDNYVCTIRNWIGIPTGKEYRMFNELLQPGLVKGKRYEANHKFAEKMMEDMEWEILELRESGNVTELDLRITNTDMTDLMGYYIIDLLEQMTESQGLGIGELVKEVSSLKNYNMSKLLETMDYLKEQGTRTEELTVQMTKVDGVWKLCLDEDFMNALMGNMNSEEFSEDVEAKIRERETQYEEKIEDWADGFEEKVEEWVH